MYFIHLFENLCFKMHYFHVIYLLTHKLCYFGTKKCEILS